MEYSVVFDGQVVATRELDEVRDNLARLFRISDVGKLDRLFSGRPVVLKSGLDAGQAEKYRQALHQAGALCTVRSTAVDLAPPSAPPSRPAPLPSPSDSAGSDPFASFGAEATTSSPLPTRPAPAPAPVAKAAAAASPFDGLALMPIEHPAPEPAPADTPASVAEAMPVARPSAGSAAGTSRTSAARRQPVAETNSSGSGATAWLPEEASGLSWGGFFLSFFWAIRHGAVAPALLCFLPVVNLGVPFYLLFKGRTIAWQRVRWASTEQFNREQRWWAIIGMLVCVVVGYRLVHGVHAVQQQALAASRMTTEERAQAQAKSLEQIKDPKQREAMLQFYQQLNELADKQKKSQ